MSRVLIGGVGSVAAVALMVLALLVVMVPVGHATMSHVSAAGPHAAAYPAPGVFHTLTISVIGLAVGTTYTVTTIGNYTTNMTQLSNDSPTSTIFTLNATAGGLPWGLYNWSIGAVPGYDLVGASSGQTNVSTANQVHAFTFVQAKVHAVTFTETGLPATTPWTVTFNGAPKTAAAPSTIVFHAENGTYAYTASPVPGFDNTNGSGMVAVVNSGSQEVDFAGSVSGSVVITSPIPVYMTVPFELTWSITVTNAAATKANVAESVTFEYETGEAIIVDAAIPFNAGHPLANFMNVTLGNLTSSYSGGTLPEGNYVVTVWLTVQNSSLWVPQPFTTTAGAGTVLSAHAPSGHFSNPTPNANVTQGTLTISGEYNGSELTSANVTVRSGTNVVFYQGVFSPQVTPNAQEGFSATFTALPGAYTVTLLIGAAYGVTSVTVKFNVTATTSVTYFNSTGGSYSIAGLGPGGSAALLVVVGLIIGELVGFILARRTSAAMPGPAQPWAPSASGTTAATTMPNECSVCHQTFATADELKEHSKTQHGITM